MSDSPLSQNLDRLPDNAKGLIAFCFESMIVGWTKCYMLEVKLDDPVTHIGDGGDGLVTHGGNGSRHYAKHYGDDDWAVVHIDDLNWEQDRWLPVGREFVRNRCSGS